MKSRDLKNEPRKNVKDGNITIRLKQVNNTKAKGNRKTDQRKLSNQYEFCRLNCKN